MRRHDRRQSFPYAISGSPRRAKVACGNSLDVPIEHPQRADVRMHQKVTAFGGTDQARDHGLTKRLEHQIAKKNPVTASMLVADWTMLPLICKTMKAK